MAREASCPGLSRASLRYQQACVLHFDLVRGSLIEIRPVTLTSSLRKLVPRFVRSDLPLTVGLLRQRRHHRGRSLTDRFHLLRMNARKILRAQSQSQSGSGHRLPVIFTSRIRRHTVSTLQRPRVRIVRQLTPTVCRDKSTSARRLVLLRCRPQ